MRRRRRTSDDGPGLFIMIGFFWYMCAVSYLSDEFAIFEGIPIGYMMVGSVVVFVFIGVTLIMYVKKLWRMKNGR